MKIKINNKIKIKMTLHKSINKIQLSKAYLLNFFKIKKVQKNYLTIKSMIIKKIKIFI